MTESVAPPRQGGSYLRLPDGSLQPNSESPAAAAESAEAVAEAPATPAAPAETAKKKKGAE